MKYYSDVLDKVFNTEAELNDAEKAHQEAEAKKAEAKALVAKESEEVQDLFKKRNAARRAYNEKLVELRKAYNEAIRTAEATFKDGLKEVAAARDEAEAEYGKKLSEFQQAHKEGYRLTLKDGDNVVTLSSNPLDFQVKSISEEFDSMLDMFSDLLRRW